MFVAGPVSMVRCLAGVEVALDRLVVAKTKLHLLRFFIAHPLNVIFCVLFGRPDMIFT